MSLKGLRFTLNIDGLPETATAVVSVVLYQTLSAPFLLSVDITNSQSDPTAPDILEKNGFFTIWHGTVPQRYLHSIITEIETGENGITRWVPSFYETHPAREVCVQYGEIDLSFLSRLWAEEGIFFFGWFHPIGPQKNCCSGMKSPVSPSTLGSLPFREGTTLSNSLDVILADRTWRSSLCRNPPLAARRVPSSPARQERKYFPGAAIAWETRIAPAGYGCHRRGSVPGNTLSWFASGPAGTNAGRQHLPEGYGD